jgi:hypothetical protein
LERGMGTVADSNSFVAGGRLLWTIYLETSKPNIKFSRSFCLDTFKLLFIYCNLFNVKELDKEILIKCQLADMSKYYFDGQGKALR